MEFHLTSISEKPYIISDPQSISTPRLLLFRDSFEFNIRKMGQLLGATEPTFDLNGLWSHAKTHKSSWVTQKLMDAGIHSFKASPNEVDMLVRAGAKGIFIAYPLLRHNAHRFSLLAASHRETTFYFQVSTKFHVDILLQAAKEVAVPLHYFVDLDIGLHRTGVAPSKAWQFFDSIPKNDSILFAGLHAYDGHNAAQDPEERRSRSELDMAQLKGVIHAFESRGQKVPRIVVGGTPSFLPDLDNLYRTSIDSEIIVSPGTWIYFDSWSKVLMPDTFEVAVCILAQVIDRVAPDTATLNLGHKRWAVDSGPLDCFSMMGMEALNWNEEHTIVKVPKNLKLPVGSYILMAPKHVCPTVNLWETFDVIDPDGRIEIRESPIDARNR